MDGVGGGHSPSCLVIRTCAKMVQTLTLVALEDGGGVLFCVEAYRKPVSQTSTLFLPFLSIQTSFLSVIKHLSHISLNGEIFICLRILPFKQDCKYLRAGIVF